MFQGIHSVLYAMFREDEHIDREAMQRQVNYCVRTGSHGITVLGLATEVHKLMTSERIELVEMVADALQNRLPFSVTIAGNSVAEQAELIQVAERNSADWIILQPPIVGTYETEVYLDFFERVAGQTDLPFAVQNAPTYLGRSLCADDIKRLRQRCQNFAAVKSEDGALGVGQIMEAAGDKLAVMGGRGGLEMLDLMQLGCKGFVLAPDIAPAAASIYKTWLSGDIQKAKALYAEIEPTIDFTMQSLEHLIAYGKRIFAVAADLDVHDRAPAMDPTSVDVKIALKHAGNMAQFLHKD